MRTRTTASWIVTTTALCALLLGGPAVPLATAEAGVEVSVQTIYLTHAIGGIRRIKIEGELGGPGRVVLDPNHCGLNLFGDTTICSEQPVEPYTVELRQLTVRDPSGEGRRVYRLVGNLPPQGYRYYLTVPKSGVGNYRLAVVSPGGAVRVLSLEELHRAGSEKGGGSGPMPVAPKGAELCEAVYTAVQRAGLITIRAHGQHGTPGHRVRFERLRGDVYPPEFRLVHLAPAGRPAAKPTPFEVDLSFPAATRVAYVHVTDAKGRQRIPVQQASGSR